MAIGTPLEGGPNVDRDTVMLAQHPITVVRADIRSRRAGAVTETPLFKVAAGA